MGFRFRKSIQIVPGVRVNVSRSGIGYSAGVKGARITKHANGRVSRTLSVPGTGLSHQSTVGGNRSRSTSTSTAPRRRTPTVAAAPVPQLPPVPPLPPMPPPHAPAWERELFQILHSRTPADYVGVAQRHKHVAPNIRILAAALEGLLHFEFADSNPAAAQRARSLLGWVVAQHVDLSADPFAQRYLAERRWPVQIVHGVTAALRISDDVLILAAAELHQSAGDLPAAIWTVEYATPTAHAALSLADLYSSADRHQEVVDLTNGVTNEDDATALLFALRGRAFAQLGYNEAARESFKEALRVRSRPSEVRHRALLERAQVDLSQNRKAAARKSIEKVLAEDPTYPGLQEALAALP
ncbi:MAG: DUF4236 domain-containing protein [Rhodococcus sp. (in: high G+C Gram-positive bacteria)]|uniref:DUF4236 domain-containing protein n=1 Tax=Rhodococcus sp. TaxID=1831 RepID=UPI00122BFFE0|nr:DUF4236 domain-containing protein [Rhodococcus sp. (in: high G+C Gram-positive bacteria)]RZL25455.1 MAG: DUF4236 domain-containing protein [Rhodococcus sp. (in: high G+C Gram-positive bacteria)]